MTSEPVTTATVQVWRDSVQKLAGNSILWVVLVERGIVRETPNRNRERWFTDPVKALFFIA